MDCAVVVHLVHVNCEPIRAQADTRSAALSADVGTMTAYLAPDVGSSSV